jgi:transcriptional regulator with XRE-family HTH domain
MSTRYSLFLPDFKLDTRKVWGLLFGEDIQGVRESKGLSVEETAGRAGMTFEQWEAVEAGKVPETWEQICVMAKGLGESRLVLASLVIRYSGAWDKSTGQDLPGEIGQMYS